MGVREGTAAELERGFAPLSGEDGWLFLAGDSNDVIAQHTGASCPAATGDAAGRGPCAAGGG